MKIRDIDWSCESSATRHGYPTEEIEGVFLGSSPKYVKTLELGVYMLLGKSKDDNLLEIFYRVTEKNEILVFHCMAMREKFRKLYLKRSK